MEAILERAKELKQALVEFVLEAEGDLASSLETFIAEQSRSQRYDATQQNLLIDRFLTEGRVGDQTPVELFLEEHAELSERDRALVQGWQQSFIGLFAVVQILPDGFELMNWLSAKHYTVKPNDPITLEEMRRFKLGEILLTRIAPVTETVWMFSGPCSPMGTLGKPKLAVAIGNFKDNYKQHLYSDAPDLLEEAWKSVEKYHQDFLDFFGSDRVTLPGYQLGKKLEEFQSLITKRQLAEAGIDETQSLADMAEAAGVDEEELQEAAESLGVDGKAMSQAIKSKEAVARMVAPKIELPPDLKKAESITVLADPRWGQMFLPTYTQFTSLLETEDWQSIKSAENLVRKYLEDPAINAYVWHQLAAQYPTQLEKVLQTVLQRPDFNLSQELDALLKAHKKPLEPELPEIASVPVHLNDLFQEALAEVNKSKAKTKDKQKTNKGFQRV